MLLAPLRKVILVHKLPRLKREALIFVKREQRQHMLVHGLIRSCHGAALSERYIMKHK